MQLISFCWIIDPLVVTRWQMPDVEYSTRLFVSSVLWGNIWVWPFLFIDWWRIRLPLLQESGSITLWRAVTWHFVVSPDRRAENEKGDTYWNNLLQFTNKASEGHLDPGWIWLPLKECCPRGSSAKLTQLSSSSSSALVKCTPLLFSVLLDPWEEVRPWI